jgi:carboxyl-terminal processing protease
MQRIKAFLFFFWIVISSFPVTAQQTILNYSRDLLPFNNVLSYLNQYYIDSLDFETINTKAINAVLSQLDPYTEYIPRAEKDKYRFLRTGYYIGFGFSILKNENDFAYISNLQANQYADQLGLKVGDELVSVEGKLSKDYSLQDLEEVFRGKLNEAIRVRVKRLGEEDTLDFLMTRQSIAVNNVAFSTMLKHNIGYIALRSFASRAASQVFDHYSKLKEQNAKALIIDLRGNGGGLIIEAVHTLNLFLERNKKVVTTRGRKSNQDYTYRTQRPPVDVAIPLVFLIDKNTASAAEILAGAAQDYDRAVLMGQNSYGKGLVQNMIPIYKSAQLKLTVARYLLPSGRGIWRDSLAIERKFKTMNGRVLEETKGLTPDVFTVAPKKSEALKDQLNKHLVFEFANRYYAQIGRPKLEASFHVSDKILSEYEQFLLEKNYHFESSVQKKIKNIRKLIEKKEGQEEVLALLNQINEKEKIINSLNHQPEREGIKKELRSAILTHQYYREGVEKLDIDQDNSVQKAIELLDNLKRYQSLLSVQK